MAKRKVIEEYNDGWKAAINEGGQVELIKAQLDQGDEQASEVWDDEEEEEEFFDGDSDDLEDDGRPAANPSDYRRYGKLYKLHCLVCGEEFESPRSGTRFCKKPTCRQKFNRQEHAVKDARATADAMIERLVGLLDDKNFAKLARGLLFSLEESLIARLDELAPDRHAKPEISVVPVRVDPASLRDTDVVFVVIDEALAIKVTHVAEYATGLFKGRPADYRGSDYNRPMYLIPRSAIFLRLVEPGEGDSDG